MTSAGADAAAKSTKMEHNVRTGLILATGAEDFVGDQGVGSVAADYRAGVVVARRPHCLCPVLAAHSPLPADLGRALFAYPHCWTGPRARLPRARRLH